MTFSLKNQTRGIYAILLLCFVGLGVLGINRLAAVSHESSIMKTVWLPRARLTDQMDDAAREYRLSESLRILSVNPGMADHADADLKENAETFTVKLAAYRKILHANESHAALDKIEALWRSYIAADPEGHYWTFSQPVRTVSNEEMEKATGFRFAPLR